MRRYVVCGVLKPTIEHHSGIDWTDQGLRDQDAVTLIYAVAKDVAPDSLR